MKEVFDTFDELPEADSEYYLNKVIRDGVNITGSPKRDKDGSFYDGESSRGYSIENGATDIGPMAFYGCLDLECINLHADVQVIGSGAFKDCQKLED